MNPRPHCSKSLPTVTGGQPKPGRITASWPTGSAGSRPGVGCPTRKRSCWLSQSATMPERIASAGELPTDDRRTARMDLVGNGRVAGVRHVAARHQTLAQRAVVLPHSLAAARRPSAAARVRGRAPVVCLPRSFSRSECAGTAGSGHPRSSGSAVSRAPRFPHQLGQRS